MQIFGAVLRILAQIGSTVKIKFPFLNVNVWYMIFTASFVNFIRIWILKLQGTLACLSVGVLCKMFSLVKFINDVF